MLPGTSGTPAISQLRSACVHGAHGGGEQGPGRACSASGVGYGVQEGWRGRHRYVLLPRRAAARAAHWRMAVLLSAARPAPADTRADSAARHRRAARLFCPTCRAQRGWVPGPAAGPAVREGRRPAAEAPRMSGWRSAEGVSGSPGGVARELLAPGWWASGTRGDGTGGPSPGLKPRGTTDR